MVVVLVVIARAPTPAWVASAAFRVNRWAGSMLNIVAEAVCGRYPCRYQAASAFTTASPISRVLTLVVPSL